MSTYKNHTCLFSEPEERPIFLIGCVTEDVPRAEVIGNRLKTQREGQSRNSPLMIGLLDDDTVR